MSESQRFGWVDTAKGIGIILVVIGHVIRGLMGAEVIAADGIFFAIDQYIYAFHMPLFFWLSGLFATKKLAVSWRKFVPQLAANILYPYFLWSSLQTLIQIAASRHTNSPATVSSLLQIPFDPPMQFWFLYVLFLVTLLYRMIARSVKGYAALLICFALALLRPFLPEGVWSMVHMTLLYLPYYALGATMLQPTHQLAESSRPLARVVFSLTCFGAILLLLNTSGPGVATALVGTAGTVSLASVCPRLSWGRYLEILGRASLQIYVAHTIASAGVRIILLRLDIRDVWMHLGLGIAAGVVFPLLLDWFVRKQGIGFVFFLRQGRRAAAVSR